MYVAKLMVDCMHNYTEMTTSSVKEVSDAASFIHFFNQYITSYVGIIDIILIMYLGVVNDSS